MKTRAKFSVTATFPETFIKVLYVGEMKLKGYIFWKFHLLTFIVGILDLMILTFY